MRSFSSAAVLLVLMTFAAVAIHLPAASAVRTSSAEGGDDDGFIENHHVHVSSGLTGGKVLLVHCQSKDDDIGIHNLTAGSEITWKFKIDAFARTTMFWCYVAPDDSHHASFDAFDADIFKLYECKLHTYWVAKDDGVYVKLIDEQRDLLNCRWQDGRAGPNLLIPKD